MRSTLGTWWSRTIAAATSTIDARIPQPGQKSLYLTFDDGPTNAGTPALLNVLDRYSVPATFFLVGRNAAQYPGRVAEILAGGHEIGNHSFSHVDAWKVSRREAIVDFHKGSRVLAELVGAPVRLMRPPYGRVTGAVAHWAIRKRQRLTLWDVMPPDFQQGISFELILKSLLGGVRNGSIICMHDNDISANVTPQTLESGLPKLLDAGWTFKLLPATPPRESADEQATG